MLQAAKALIQVDNNDLADDTEAILQEFKTKFCDTELFFDPFAGAKFAHYLFRIHEEGQTTRVDEIRRRIEAAQLFIESAAEVALDAFIPVFHRWIQTQWLDDVLIDVADYRHVPHGPGVVLIGHDAHYAMDQSDGRLGLLYSRRRETLPSRRHIQSVETRLQSVCQDALSACQQLETEAVFQGKLRFRTDALQLRINDRLLAPNGVSS